ncbi:hypothetical protein NIES2107_56640 [Nostoc carneum NIES-2107]|nr:hypothetical protein NIES2107_56640 [Nostoc carneum NIES-2107]
MNYLIYLIVILSVFGQPNGLFLILPEYPLVALVSIWIMVIFIIARKIIARQLNFISLNIYVPLCIFFVYSALSLGYAPDPGFGARLLISMFFKVIVFLIIIYLCNDKNYLKQLLQVIAFMGVLFSAQSLLLVLGVAIFDIQPISEFNETAIEGLVDYDYKLVYYGALGFAKQYIGLLGLRIPRCQSMFIEPGWFANFLELSIFATLGYSTLVKTITIRRLKLMILIQGLALFFSFSTAAWFSVCIGYLIYVSLTNNSVTLNKKNKNLIIIILIIITLLSSILLFPEILAEVYKIVWLDKFDNEWGATSAGDRANAITLAQELFMEKPLLGWGINQMRIVADGIGANNAIMTIAVELGIIGITVYFTILLAIIKAAIVNCKTALRSQLEPIITLTASSSACVASLITHSIFVDSNWSFYYWIGLAFLYANYLFLKAHKVSQGYLSVDDNL